MALSPVFCFESGEGKGKGEFSGVEGELRGGRRSTSSKIPSSIFGLLKHGQDNLNSALLYLRDGLTEEGRETLRLERERRQILLLRLQNAETLKQWRSAAKELDILEGNDLWKQDATSSPHFDAALIEDELRLLDQARTNCDIRAMLYLVRTSLCRGLGGMDDLRLYMQSYIGTKDLVDRYIDSTVETIQALVELSKRALPEGIEVKDILEQVVYARQSFGRSALLLSGGATFGMNHVGVLKALHEAKLLPRIISGASAGSIVCAVLCTRTDEELPQVLKDFPYMDLAVFEEEGKEDGILDRIRRLLTHGAWIDISHLKRLMQSILGDMTFQEAYNRTRRILNICVSSASVYELPRLLNYVTAPNVMIWSAVAASCSVPLLFSAAQLLVKNPLTGANTPWDPTPQGWIDGSVDNDLPMTRLAEIFNVNHFIVSQVNPHVIPFLAKDASLAASIAHDPQDLGPGWIYNLTALAKSEALHRMHVLAELGIFPNLMSKCRSVLSQKYSGDITILPQINYKDFSRILKNPTSDFMIQACLCGERATWPKLSRIRNSCQVELELDAAVRRLRARVVFSPSQMDLRRMTSGFSRGGRKSSDGVSIKSIPYRNADPDEESSDSEVAINIHAATPSRPGLRSSHSYRSALAESRSTTSPPQISQPPRASPARRKPLHSEPTSALKIPAHSPGMDFSSAGEETLVSMSDADVDADVDSRTEDSSPERGGDTKLTSAGEGNGSGPASVDVESRHWFGKSQPVTGGRDWVDATSPIAKRGLV